MPSISIQAGQIPITGASATLGVLTALNTDVANVYPGSWAWLAKTNGSGSPVKVKVLAILTTTTFSVRVYDNQADEYGNGQQAGAFYTFKDISTFATASTLYWNTQTVPVDPSFSKRSLP